MGERGCDFARCQGSLGRGTPGGKGRSGLRGGWPRFPLHEALRASGWLCVRQGASLESPRAGRGMHRGEDCFCVSGGRGPQRARARPAPALPHSPPEVKGHRAAAAARDGSAAGQVGRGAAWVPAGCQHRLRPPRPHRPPPASDTRRCLRPPGSDAQLGALGTAPAPGRPFRRTVKGAWGLGWGLGAGTEGRAFGGRAVGLEAWRGREHPKIQLFMPSQPPPPLRFPSVSLWP